MEDISSEHGDIIQDAQFFQDTAMDYQVAYHSLEDRYTHQAVLMKEASETLQASESQTSAMQQELLAFKHNREADIQRAVRNAVSQYQQHLSSAQFCTCNHQSAIMQLRDQVWTLQLSLASWGICLLWVHPKGRQILGGKCSTSSWGQLTLIKALPCT